MFGFDRFKSMKKQAKIVLKSRFLDNLTPLERYEFLQLCHRRDYNEGEYIYYQGDPGTGMYFLEEGKVELIVEPEAGSGEETNTFLIEAPESFGALSIGYELRRMSSAKCITDAVLLGFFKPDFETLRDRHPKIAVKFLETLSMIAMKQLEKTTDALKEAKGVAETFSIQFSTYYQDEQENEIH